MKRRPKEVRFTKIVLTIIFLLSVVVLWTLNMSATSNVISYRISRLSMAFTGGRRNRRSNESDYLVFSSACLIPNSDAFSEEIVPFYHLRDYAPCHKKPLLTYVTRRDNKTAVLHVDEAVIPLYSNHGIACCYSVVGRKVARSAPDDKFKLSPCKDFTSNATIISGTFLVKCNDTETRKQVYVNTHAVVLIKREIQKKLNEFDRSSPFLSVLLVGIDSISRLNMQRMMPNTYHHLQDKGWIEFVGYNKMGDNTFPNLMAMFTGKNETTAYNVCNPSKLAALDKCNFIFFNYSGFGYVTGYAEDESNLATFNYHKKGFFKPPTDYYFRPYALASESLPIRTRDGMKICVGPENYGDRILNVAKDFAITFKQQPSFGFFWMNSFSHNQLNAPSAMDHKVRGFFEDIAEAGVLNNSFVIFLSDHGLRFGEFRITALGWLEERLPFLFFSVPKWFQERFPREYANLRTNANRLTSPYDLYLTLQDVLVKSGKDHVMEPASGCSTCKSLFDEADRERSCSQAGIKQHWCTCAGYKRMSYTETLVDDAAWSVIKRIEEIKKEDWSQMKHCKKYNLGHVISSDVYHEAATGRRFLKLAFQTEPKAVFEATVELIAVNEEAYEFVIQDGISRLDSYAETTKCVADPRLKMFCYCSEQVTSKCTFSCFSLITS